MVRVLEPHEKFPAEANSSKPWKHSRHFQDFAVFDGGSYDRPAGPTCSRFCESTPAAVMGRFRWPPRQGDRATARTPLRADWPAATGPPAEPGMLRFMVPKTIGFHALTQRPMAILYHFPGEARYDGYRP